jgi:hypothetical protein
MPSALTMDASLNKSFQFRAEAFNFLNHFVTLRAKYNSDPNSAIFPGDLWTGDTASRGRCNWDSKPTGSVERYASTPASRPVLSAKRSTGVPKASSIET